jgi:uncharacterized protein
MPSFPRLGLLIRFAQDASFPKAVWFAVSSVWLAAAIAAWLLLPQHIPISIRIPFLFAACIELFFFIPLGWPAVREGLIRVFPARQLAMGMFLSALLPFLVYALGAGVFSVQSLGLLVLLSGLASFWYVVLPEGRLRDAGFLALIAAVMLGGWFQSIYPDAAPKLQAEFLGRVLWIRLGISAALLLRRMPGVGFGWWPSPAEWRAGVLGFVLLFPLLFALGRALAFFEVRQISHAPFVLAGITLGTFFGILWVVALSEEFFLRGLLQQWLRDWLSSAGMALLLTSLISGALHLPFRDFPNWKFALLATVAHAGYGWVFMRAGGIRAAMVCHALVVTVWRVFLV